MRVYFAEEGQPVTKFIPPESSGISGLLESNGLIILGLVVFLVIGMVMGFIPSPVSFSSDGKKQPTPETAHVVSAESPTATPVALDPLAGTCENPRGGLIPPNSTVWIPLVDGTPIQYRCEPSHPRGKLVEVK
jgi:hypothetical protein